MTTIAWDGKTLAADRQVTCGDIRNGERTKLRRLTGGRLAAWCGESRFQDKVLEALERYQPYELPVDDGAAILIEANGELKLYEGNTNTPLVRQAPFAIGSGRVAAQAALILGHSAEEAVWVATQLDIYSGGGIDSLSLAGTHAEPEAVHCEPSSTLA